MKRSKTPFTIENILLFFLIIWLTVMTYKMYKDSNDNKEVVIEYPLNNEEFSEENLIELIKKLNFKYPEVVLAQTMLETSFYKSNIFRENQNLFGMKQAYSRVNLNEGTKNGHAVYSYWKESVIDYGFYYSTYLYKCKTRDELLKTLNRIYAGDPIYDKKLQQLIVEHNLLAKFL
jgi:hypothetical protein